MAELRPTVLMFVYKRVLDNVLRLGFGRREKAAYGFNPLLDPLFGARVFVFPMPGMMGGGDLKPVGPLRQGFAPVTIKYRLWKMGGTVDLDPGLKLQILDDERKVVFEKDISSRPGSYTVKWSGKDARGAPASWGLYTVRIVGPVTLHASALLEVERY